jgi:hypothetical protein
MVQSKFDAAETVDKEAAADLMGGEEVVVRQSTAMAAVGEVQGELSRSDIMLPRMQFIQSVGPMSREFDPGDIVLSKEICIAKKDQPLTVVVLSVKKYFQERFEKFDLNGPRPLRFDTEAEVLKAGLVLEWDFPKKGCRPTAEPLADIVVMIQKPEGNDSPVFSLTIGGKLWSAAVWTTQRTSYSRAAKRIFTARAVELSAGGLLSGVWTLSSHEASINSNLVFVPSLALVGRNDDATMAEIKAVFAGKK